MHTCTAFRTEAAEKRGRQGVLGRAVRWWCSRGRWLCHAPLSTDSKKKKACGVPGFLFVKSVPPSPTQQPSVWYAPASIQAHPSPSRRSGPFRQDCWLPCSFALLVPTAPEVREMLLLRFTATAGASRELPGLSPAGQGAAPVHQRLRQCLFLLPCPCTQLLLLLCAAPGD